MIIVLKKANIAFFCAAVIFAVIAVHFALGQSKPVPAATVPANNKIIVLDAGHGTPDGGAVGVGGTLEKDLNLAICKKVQSLLEKSGGNIVLTRADDGSISDVDGSIREMKRSDLKNRRKARDESGADIFVSIHMNKFPAEKYRGAQVFYSKTPENAKLLGETIQAELIKSADPSNTRVAKVSDNSIYILKDSDVPSVIVECGFLSNAEEEKLLKTDAYQEKIAWGIYTGIQKYFVFAKEAAPAE